MSSLFDPRFQSSSRAPSDASEATIARPSSSETARRTSRSLASSASERSSSARPSAVSRCPNSSSTTRTRERRGAVLGFSMIASLVGEVGSSDAGWKRSRIAVLREPRRPLACVLRHAVNRLDRVRRSVASLAKSSVERTSRPHHPAVRTNSGTALGNPPSDRCRLGPGRPTASVRCHPAPCRWQWAHR